MDTLRPGPIGRLIGTDNVLEMDGGQAPLVDAAIPAETVVAAYLLQDVSDYRAALRTWFEMVAIGGHLVVAVPHSFLFERQLALPSRWRPQQRRLYTPASLLGEVEEALVPNAYRVRWLADGDSDYAYTSGLFDPPVGPADIVLVLERLTAPAWNLLDRPSHEGNAPDFSFEPQRTRIESAVPRPREHILLLKLDHLGDFIMGLPALQKARAAFPNSHITLVVGSWNAAMANDLGIADRVIVFDIFPRNSSEESVDVAARATLLKTAIDDYYDIVIDLRTDPDTRFLLRDLKAGVKAGLGTYAEFPFLDIFLPIDATRHEPETAREDRINHHAFQSHTACSRNQFRIACDREAAPASGGTLIWGPYRELRAGRYIFEPAIELDEAMPGVLACDIALDTERVAVRHLPSSAPLRFEFTVEKPNSLFEFRIWAVKGERPAGFRFDGGRLLRQGAMSVLHQSEYLALLLELVVMRTAKYGVLGEVS